MDLNMMMREQARNGLQAQLDAAVTNGDTEAARKVAKDIAALEVSTAPKSAPYGSEDIKAELNKQDWFGVDPKKSAKAMEFGKTMDLAKFPTAAAFAAAVVKAVDEEFKPAKADDAGEGDDEAAKVKTTSKSRRAKKRPPYVARTPQAKATPPSALFAAQPPARGRSWQTRRPTFRRKSSAVRTSSCPPRRRRNSAKASLPRRWKASTKRTSATRRRNSHGQQHL
jgi:hypothetical protein